MDFITKLPPSKGATTMLVVVDMLTKMAHFILCSGLPMAQTTAQLFICHVFQLHRLPDWVVTDRGVKFMARVWQAVLKELKIQVCLSLAHHPDTDCITEQMNAILEQYLHCFINQQQDNWADMLVVAKFAYNNSQHTSTQVTPFFTS